MPRVDDDLRRLLDSDDPALDEDLKRLGLLTSFFVLFVIFAVVLVADWLGR